MKLNPMNNPMTYIYIIYNSVVQRVILYQIKHKSHSHGAGLLFSSRDSAGTSGFVSKRYLNSSTCRVLL